MQVKLACYSSARISSALGELCGLAVPSRRRILKYAKEHDLCQKVGFNYLIPEAKLGALVRGMEIPVRLSELYQKLTSTDEIFSQRRQREA